MPAEKDELDPRFSVVYLLLFVGLLVTELIGVKRKEGGDTITNHWQWVEKMLDAKHYGAALWFFRVFTIGALGWVILHLVTHTV